MNKLPEQFIPSAGTKNVEDKTWVEQWRQMIVNKSGLPNVAIQELFESTESLGNLIMSFDGEERCVKGMVVGNVQSGKTASMIGVAATAFDMGYDIVVILTGIDNTLRSQTHSRFNSDLFQYNDELMIQDGVNFVSMDPPRKVAKGNLGKNPNAKQGYIPLEYTSGLNQFLNGSATNTMMKAFIGDPKRKLLVTALKNKKLVDLGKEIRDLNEVAKSLDRGPIRVMVIDDESDFASAPGDKKAKAQINIQDLWTESYTVKVPGENFDNDDNDFEIKEFQDFPSAYTETIEERTERFAMYIGYTATPHGVVKNRFDNQLRPDDFIFTLKSSGGYHDNPDLEPSERVYYPADNKVNDWYCGGHVYYKLFENEEKENFLIQDIPEIEPDRIEFYEDLDKAFIDYIVSGSIRWIEKGFNQESPISHSMLIHNGSGTKQHYKDACTLICNILKHLDDKDDENLLKLIERRVEVYNKISGNQAELKKERQKWFAGIKEEFQKGKSHILDVLDTDTMKEMIHSSYKGFQESRDVLLEVRPGCRSEIKIPDLADVIKVIPHVIENLKLRIINGVGCGETLNFDETIHRDDETELPPFDSFSIVIGGEMLGRGITLKNLATTYFLKSATKQNQDTYIQRQRWFGYRGRMLEFCRVYMPKTLTDYLTNAHTDLEVAIDWWNKLHEDGESMDSEKWWMMTTSDADSISNKANQGKEVHYSGWLYPTHFVESPNLNFPEYRGKASIAKQNFDITKNLIQKIIDEGTKISPAKDGGVPLTGKPDQFHGYLLGEPLNHDGNAYGAPLEAMEVADLFDSLEFTNHHPDPGGEYVRHFDTLCTRMGLNPGDLHKHFTGFTNRDAMKTDPPVSMSENQNPYLISAWLKYWEHLWHLHNGGGIPPGIADGWNPIAPPKFNVVAWSNEGHGHKTTIEFTRSKDNEVQLFNTYNGKLTNYGITASHWSNVNNEPDKFGGWVNLDDFRDHGWDSGTERKEARKEGENGLLIVRLLDKGPKVGNIPKGVSDAEHRPKMWINIPEGGPSFNFA